jgi:hypothetical protein
VAAQPIVAEPVLRHATCREGMSALLSCLRTFKEKMTYSTAWDCGNFG